MKTYEDGQREMREAAFSVCMTLPWADGKRIPSNRAFAEAIAALPIAPAELMAKRHAELIEEVEHLKQVASRRLGTIGELERRVSALRGVVTRQKKLVKEAEAQRDSLRKAMHQLEDMKPGILMAGVISRALELGE